MKWLGLGIAKQPSWGGVHRCGRGFICIRNWPNLVAKQSESRRYLKCMFDGVFVLSLHYASVLSTILLASRHHGETVYVLSPFPRPGALPLGDAQLLPWRWGRRVFGVLGVEGVTPSHSTFAGVTRETVDGFQKRTGRVTRMWHRGCGGSHCLRHHQSPEPLSGACAKCGDTTP